MYVLAFDRDWTVDVNPHPRREAVPLEWVRYWAHETAHEVWAIGNQDLVEEADIPGTVESIRRRDGDIEALGERDDYGRYAWWPEREERLRILAGLFPEADGYVVVDDLDLSHVDGWDHYHAWDFVEHVRNGDLDLTPPSDGPVPDGGFRSRDAVRDVLSRGHVFELTHGRGRRRIWSRALSPTASRPSTRESVQWDGWTLGRDRACRRPLCTRVARRNARRQGADPGR